MCVLGVSSIVLFVKVCFEMTFFSALSSEDARDPEEAEGGEQEASARGQVKEDPVPFILVKFFFSTVGGWACHGHANYVCELGLYLVGKNDCAGGGLGKD